MSFSARRSLTMCVDRWGDQVVDDPKWRFSFPDPGPLGVPMLQLIDVGFGYDPSRPLFDDVNFGMTMDSRLVILGKNGSGKSTLLKLILGELNPTNGRVVRHPKLRVACFTQVGVGACITAAGRRCELACCAVAAPHRATGCVGNAAGVSATPLSPRAPRRASRSSGPLWLGWGSCSADDWYAQWWWWWWWWWAAALGALCGPLMFCGVLCGALCSQRR
jgi:hypothetical protein